MKKISSKVLTPFAALIALALAPQAFAQTITASDTNATINSQHVASVTIDRAGQTVRGFVFTLNYDTTYLSFPTQHTDPDAPHPNVTTVGTGGADFGCTENTVGSLLCVASTSITSPTFVVNIDFSVGGDAVDAPGTPLTFGTGIGVTNFVDAAFADTEFTSVEDGSVVIAAAAPDVVLGFNPTSNVVFTGGVSGSVSNTSIAVSVASGTIGTGTIDNCVVSGPNASAFSVVAPGSVTAPPPGSLDLQVTLANSALSATLTCDLDDASAATTKVFQLSAPAGSPVPAPEYTSTPPGGSALTCNGAPDSTASTSVTITNSGDLPLTFDCSVSGAGFSLVSGGVGNLAPGASQVVNVDCQVPAEGAPSIEGDLDCTSNDPAASANNYPLSSIAASGPPPIPQPNVVPASSLWSQISLIGLMAALGLLVVGIRRKG